MRNPITGVSIILALAAPAITARAATAYFKTDFQTGYIPKTITVADRDGHPVMENAYKRGATADGWRVEVAGSKGYAAVSPTHTGPGTDDIVQLNTLATPAFTVADSGAVLRWVSRSMLPGFEEAYEVVAIEGDGTETPLFSTGAESDWWATHAVGLGQFEGKEIQVEWRCVSANRYMLALDDIFAGVPDADTYSATDMTQRFQAASGVRVRGEVLNAGLPSELTAIVLRIGGAEADRIALEGEWLPGETRSFDMGFTAAPDLSTAYAVAGVKADGSEVALCEGSVWTSHFARRHVVDAASGMWCNNCVDGHLDMEAMQRAYPGQVIPLEIHANDIFAVDEYWARMEFYAAPFYMLNRDQNVKTSNRTRLTDAMQVSTVADLRVKQITRYDGGPYSFTVAADVAESLDNSAGRYRVGYVVVRDVYSPDPADGVYQQNGATIASKEQYYFLPSVIYAGLVKMHNVVTRAEGAFGAAEGTLPASLEPGVTSEVGIDLELPEYDADPSAARVVFLLLDTETGQVLNADVAELADADTSGVESVEASAPGLGIRMASGRCELTLDPEGGDWRLEIYDVAGRLLALHTGSAADTSAAPAVEPGVVIARLSQGASSATARLIVR